MDKRLHGPQDLLPLSHSPNNMSSHRNHSLTHSEQDGEWIRSAHVSNSGLNFNR